MGGVRLGVEGLGFFVVAGLEAPGGLLERVGCWLCRECSHLLPSSLRATALCAMVMGFFSEGMRDGDTVSTVDP